ncbi:VanZ family protein [Brachybacterium sp. J144]|uniref:VanZ family protein n=1 Tax=Brachybacterium sp. J144 TaxID=3116487 RepID=UPI002E771160|nr:VanZ family protein [Brachybacterium sp. J144]MEE1650777.1 VanZ family protein [Brachybacterium sp. J144]
MSELLNLAVVGVVGGLGVFAVALLPACWLQRRRFGRIRPDRLLAIAVICVYTMTLAGLTIAPAYDVALTCRSRTGGALRADPFHTLREVLALRRAGGSWWAVATSFPVVQVALNTALFVPLGMILRGVFRLDATASVAIGLMLSALIEVTQFTGAFGIYPCGVRIADIEDLLANWLGAFVGVLLVPLARRLRVPLFVHADEDTRPTDSVL